jgi:hypothetical protein
MTEHRMSSRSSPFSFFVTAVEGEAVPRYTAAGQGPFPQIGMTRTPTGPVWDTETVHAFTPAEMAQHGHLYHRAIREGALKPATLEDYEAYLAKQSKASKTANPPPAAAAATSTTASGRESE